MKEIPGVYVHVYILMLINDTTQYLLTATGNNNKFTHIWKPDIFYISCSIKKTPFQTN